LWWRGDIANDDVQAAMHELVENALADCMPDDADAVGVALLHGLQRSGRQAAALRLGARLLLGATVAAETPQSRDRAACCLLLAAVAHRDALAAVEFAAFAERRAVLMEGDQTDPSLPPGFRTPAQLARRMRRQARWVLAHRFSLPSRDGLVRSLVQAALADPLAGYVGDAPHQEPDAVHAALAREVA